MPVVGIINARSAEGSAQYGAAFRKGLEEAGYLEGQNVTVEYHWLGGRYDRLPSLMADLVRRRVAVIARRQYRHCARGQSGDRDDPDRLSASGEDPVKLGLVASLSAAGRQRDRYQFFRR